MVTYNERLPDKKAFRQYLDEIVQTYPELFPDDMRYGYKLPENLPQHLLADEKHARFQGNKAYIATTVANDCVLGASVSLTADTADLTEAYGCFKDEWNRCLVGFMRTLFP